MKICKVKSIKEPQVIEVRSLTAAKGRKETGLFLLYGLEQLSWAVEKRVKIQSLFVVDNIELQEELTRLQVLIYQCGEGILKKISDTNYLVPILAVAVQKRIPLQPTTPL